MPEARVLFVPKDISWEAQYERGVKLVGCGYSVWIHDHSFNNECPRLDAPNGAAPRCGELTTVDGAVRLVPVQDTIEQ